MFFFETAASPVTIPTPVTTTPADPVAIPAMRSGVTQLCATTGAGAAWTGGFTSTATWVPARAVARCVQCSSAVDSSASSCTLIELGDPSTTPRRRARFRRGRPCGASRRRNDEAEVGEDWLERRHPLWRRRPRASSPVRRARSWTSWLYSDHAVAERPCRSWQRARLRSVPSCGSSRWLSANFRACVVEAALRGSSRSLRERAPPRAPRSSAARRPSPCASSTRRRMPASSMPPVASGDRYRKVNADGRGRRPMASPAAAMQRRRGAAAPRRRAVAPTVAARPFVVRSSSRARSRRERSALR